MAYGLKLCYCLLILSYAKPKSFVRSKSLPSGPANFIQLSSDLLNVKHLLEDELSQTSSKLEKHPQEVKNWPRRPLDREIPLLGQVSGVAVKANGNPVIFHRGPVEWDSSSFNENHEYNHFDRPIGIPPIVELDEKSGSVVKSWGEDIFYMPHSITIDSHGHYWLTDVALHQVIKMKEGESEPLLTLGEARVPGSDDHHFCKPTDVAVSSTGVVFVSDGYCNSRIVKFDSEGNTLDSWGEAGELYVPHAITLLESRDMLCVADREHKRVMCYQAGLRSPDEAGNLLMSVSDKEMGPVYGVASYGRLIFAVTTPRRFFGSQSAEEGITIDADSGRILDSWSPNMGFETPHSVAVDPNGNAIYVAQIGESKVWKFIT